MATLTYKDGTSTSRGPDMAGAPGVVVFSNTIDMSELSSNTLTTGTDNIPLFDLPAGSIVLSSTVEVLTAADTTSGTLDVGSTGTEVTQVTNPDSAGITMSSTASTYSSDVTISARAGTADVVNGKFRIDVAVMLPGV